MTDGAWCHACRYWTADEKNRTLALTALGTQWLLHCLTDVRAPLTKLRKVFEAQDAGACACVCVWRVVENESCLPARLTRLDRCSQACLCSSAHGKYVRAFAAPKSFG